MVQARDRSTGRPMPVILQVAMRVELLLCVSVLLAGRHVLAQSGFSVEENSGANHYVGTFTAEPGATEFGFQALEVQDNCSKYFTINGTTGDIRTLVDLDREAIYSAEGKNELQCSVRYTAEDMKFFVTTEIVVQDINDNVPMFLLLHHPVHSIDVSDSMNVGSRLYALYPVDDDNGTNGTVEFSIVAGNEEGYFRLEGEPDEETESITLYLNKILGPTTARQFNLTIILSDMGTPQQSSTQYLVINIVEMVLTNIRFNTTLYNIMVNESQPVGPSTPIAVIEVDDPGSRNLNYSIRSTDEETLETFGVVSNTGALYLKKELDFEEIGDKEFRAELLVWDLDSGHSDDTNIIFALQDVNDEAPFFAQFPVTGNQLSEESVELVEGDDVPHQIARFSIVDRDSANEFDTISEEVLIVMEPQVPLRAVVSIALGSTILDLYIDESLDREEVSSFVANITVTNVAPPHLQGSLTVYATVLDLNDNTPQFTEERYATKLADSAPLDKEVITVVATDGDAEENGTVSYSIVAVQPTEASDWFAIHPSNGTIFVVAQPHYSTESSHVTLMVEASDSAIEPLTNSTTVEVAISPAVTFTPRSYQLYQGKVYDIIMTSEILVYLEFSARDGNGVLLHQSIPGGKSLTLELENWELQCRYGNGPDAPLFRPPGDEMAFLSDDEWYSVQMTVQEESVELEVWLAGERRVESLLQSSVAKCEDDCPDTCAELFLGGVDLETLATSGRRLADFMGAMRNVIIGDVQVDLSCPTEEANVAVTVLPSSGGCGLLVCDGKYFTGCVDYGTGSYCNCIGGFSPDSCQDERGDYGAIGFSGEGQATVSLGHDFFHDLISHGDVSSDISGTVFRRKRRRRMMEEVQGGEQVLQVVELGFRPSEIRAGVLLYSETPSAAHVLKVSDPKTLIYMVFLEDGQYSQPIHLTMTATLVERELYTATLNFTDKSVHFSLTPSGGQSPSSYNWTDEPLLFAEAPETRVSLVRANNVITQSSEEFFTGCITALTINGLRLPLSGLAREGGFNQSGGEGTVEECDLCECEACDTVDPCTHLNLTCQPNHFNGTHQCVCPEGLVLEGVECISITTPGTEPITEDNVMPLYLIIVVALGALIILGSLVITALLCLRFSYNRRQKHMYNVSHTHPHSNGHISSTEPNLYGSVDHKSHHHESTPELKDEDSVGTFQQHDIDDEEGSPEPPSSRRKSTTSAETGFHTGSERDERSIPRMEDSGNEKETDYSMFDSESSEDLTASGVEEVLSPHNVNLVATASSDILGHPRPPLTPKERKVITPLRPTSNLILSMSECEDDEVFTPKRMFLPPRSSYSRPRSKSSDGELSQQPWFKSSTASDNEREKRRARGNCSYYPTRSAEPFGLPTQSPTTPKDYKPLLPFSHAAVPNAYSSLPHRKRAQTVDSPLKLVHRYEDVPGPIHKYEDVPSPVSEPHRNAHPNKSLKPSVSQPVRFHTAESPLYLPQRQYSDEHDYTPPSFVYPRSLSSGGEGEKKFQDLKSVSRINPISFWEMQQRMKVAVDQEDPYNILSEPFVPFEDVSTEPSMIDSSITMEEPVGPEHQQFSSQGGGEGTADMMDLRLRDEELDSLVTDSTLQPPITHFPSADGSDDYTHESLGTLVGSSSGESTPRHPSPGGFIMPPLQGQVSV